MTSDVAKKEQLLPAAELDLAAALFRDAVASHGIPTRHRRGIPESKLAEVGAVWRDGSWRASYASWPEYLAAEHGVMPREPRRLGSDARPVYFIQAAGGPIKIGVAAHPARRLADLQTSSPYELRLLATMPGQGALGESALHAKFEHRRMRGEWFAPAPDLLAYIEANGVPA